MTLLRPSLFLGVLVGAIISNAKPIGPGDLPTRPICDAIKYEITKTTPHQAGNGVVSNVTCNGLDDCELSSQIGFSVGTTVEVGLDIGLDFEALAGAAGISGSVSVSQTTEYSTGQGVSVSCKGGPWSCAMAAYPPVTKVEGFQWDMDDNCRPIPESKKEYKVDMLENVKDGILSAYYLRLCTCQNQLHWADPGHPGLLCPQDCVPGPAVE